MRWRPDPLADPLVGAACLGWLGMALPLNLGAAELFNEIARARDLICEMRAPAASRTTASRGNAPRNVMIVIENVAVDSPTARLVSSATVGARKVRVYSGDTGVHFVEDVEASVKVTTLQSCTRWNEVRRSDKNPGGRQCTRYEAVNRWHFDTSVHRNADQAFLRLSANSYTGWCEPWRMD